MSYPESFSRLYTISFSGQGTLTATPAPKLTPLLIPFYVYPGSEWTTLARAKCPPGTLATINPDSGPGSSLDSNYVAGIKSLQQAGLKVLGYVPTNWAGTPASAVEGMCQTYKSWYNVDGIFFDQMPNAPADAPYCWSLQNYAKETLGMSVTVGNPGTGTTLVGIFDITNVDEGAGYPHASNLSPYKPTKISFISYGVASLDQSVLSPLLPLVECFYVTDDALPNPYNSLPSYLAQLTQI